MKIEWQIKVEDSRLLELRVDGEVWKVVARPLFRRDMKGLKRCSSMEELEALFSTLEQKAALQEAFRLLAARDHFAMEVQKKLEAKGLSQEAVAFAIKKCEDLGYLDEKRLIERTIQTLKRRGKGPRFIAQKLRERVGYIPDIPRGTEEEIAALLHKRAGASREKAIRFLLSRGFDLESILKALDKSVTIE